MYYECLNCGRYVHKDGGVWVHQDTQSSVCWIVFASPALP